MKHYTSIEAIEGDPALIGYVRVLRRAWSAFDLDLVLCVNGVPTLFRTSRQRIVDPEELAELHRKFWNQGVASILLVKDPKSALILSALQPPQTVADLPAATDQLSGLVKDLGKLTEAGQNAVFRSVENGEFYRHYNQKFQSKGLVDQSLTRNLSDLSLLLQNPSSAKPVPEETAHHFICRLLFTCYLVDRGIYRLPDQANSAAAHLHEALAARRPDEACPYLYGIFRQLKRKFNGSMFDQDLDAEETLIAPHMERIVGFLQGDEMKSGQASLGFWAYDFKFIPIETISGIYENFLTDTDRKGKGAHYTPRLLAEMTLDIACEDSPDWDKLRYFDPCCGSGIFIVTLFNRLATSWELKNPRRQANAAYNSRKTEALLGILKNQIRGMDIKPAACTLGCFSLYVAFLDSFEPADIETHEKTFGKLPKILKKNGNTPDIPVIHLGDSLAATRFRDDPFDRLIGNPPWGGSGGRGSNDPSFKFIIKADEWLKPGGQACLLLPSKNFLNLRNENKQAAWLANHRLDRVVQLADFRFILFPSAKCPCMAVRFRNEAPPPDHAVIYDTPKYDLSARRKGFIRITSSDRKSVPQARLIHAATEARDAHVLWKQLFWGSPRDQRLLQYLDGFGELAEIAGLDREEKRWISGEGFILGNRSEQTWWNADARYIGARSKILDHSFLLMPDDSEQVGDRFIHAERSRGKNRKIFQPPHVLVSQGFGKVVFADFPVLFQDSLQGIHGPPEDEDLLLFLTAYLQSNLAKYYCFHTSSKLGIERDVVRFEELLRLPFPLPKDAPSENAQEIVDNIAASLRKEKAALEKLAPQYADLEQREDWLTLRKKRAHQLRAQFEPLIYQYFGLLEPEQALVEDAFHIFLPSSTPTTPDTINLRTLAPIASASTVPGYEDGLGPYADTLVGTLNTWAKEQKSEWRVNAEGWIGDQSGLAMVRLRIVPTKEKRPFSPKLEGHALWPQVYEKLSDRQASLQIERQLIGFIGAEFFVLRPQSLVNWTRTQALNDADEFFAQYLQHGKGARR